MNIRKIIRETIEEAYHTATPEKIKFDYKTVEDDDGDNEFVHVVGNFYNPFDSSADDYPYFEIDSIEDQLGNNIRLNSLDMRMLQKIKDEGFKIGENKSDL